MSKFPVKSNIPLIRRHIEKMNPFKALVTPQYLFRPSQILRRIRRSFDHSLPEFATSKLPWGDVIRYRPAETIGAQIHYYGLFDLAVAELITRLLEPGEQAIDVGANIGQMTSLMMRCVGRSGRVFAFEPHPELFEELEFNVGRLRWSDTPETRKRLVLLNVALSDRDGEALLRTGPEWKRNRGLAKVVDATGAEGVETRIVRRLAADGLLKGEGRFALCKIDVEGHEKAVLAGARELLSGRRIRDILFEDFDPYPSVVQELLMSFGYSVFSVSTRIRGPLLEPLSSRSAARDARDGHNYVATLEPERLFARVRKRGWKVLHR